jgi:hypothetical protein
MPPFDSDNLSKFSKFSVIRSLAFLFACIVLRSPCEAQPTSTSQSSDQKVEFFEAKIRPVLAEHCWSCHSQRGNKSNGGLQLDSLSAIAAGGDNGPVVLVNDLKNSLLLRAIQGGDDDVPAMPPSGSALSPQQVRDFRRWVTDGAVVPESIASQEAEGGHWAFRPVAIVEVPDVSNSWPRTDIDRFVLAKQLEYDLKPAKDASWNTIARRMSVAITGLPPTLQTLDRLGKVAESAGLSEMVKVHSDELLTSSHFGVRWARHWMDLVRYSESAGHEYDYEIEGAWRYRDYLVRAFNSDLPFNQMVREHIAGDLMPARVFQGRNESLLATGWWQLQEQPTSPVDILKDEAERLDNQIDVLGKAFQGLTIGCARCHDHKFDPIPTNEYYGLFGIMAASPGIRCWANEPALDQATLELERRRDTWESTQPEFKASSIEPTAEPTSEADRSWSSLVGDRGSIVGDLAQLPQQLATKQ